NDDLRKGMQPVADVIRRPETTVSEIPDPDSTQPIVIDTDPQKTTVKPEGIST
ncbi:hypothetical protein LCGC14_2360100, partial [marine sediment metagenome]